ncbi:endonuclease/exonuclease/phosphatase family protein [Patescibacteria group bacterium]
MRIIYLNTWYGQIKRDFFSFLKDNVGADVFCFQEVSPQLFNELENILSNHGGIYATENKAELMGFVYGQAIFIRKNFKILSSGKVDLYRQVINDVGYLQFVQVKIGQKEVCLGNIHGKARPGYKLDTPARIRQSRIIIDYFKNKKGAKIIGGDFNLLPQTKSIKMFEKAGYRNLIDEYKIKITRNRLAWEQFPNEEKQYFADYVFTSSDIKVKNFVVPNIEISDHLPLILDFEI